MFSVPTFPMPPELAQLPNILAEPWVKIGTGSVEGAVCDRNGNLYMCHRSHPWSEIVKVFPDGHTEIFYHDDDAALVGLMFHKDGRLFAADIDRGRILELSTDGFVLRDLLAGVSCKKMMPDDICFDNCGNLYFTDMSGDIFHTDGGIYCMHMSTDYTDIELIVGGLRGPNGLAFSNDGETLWISETPCGTLDRIMLTPEHKMDDFFLRMVPVYHSTGFEVVDSLKVDADGNIYLCIMFGGRLILFNPAGIPVANIILSDRSHGACMQSPNMALHPSKKEGYIVANGINGAWIYRFESPAPSAGLYAYL